VVAAGGRQVSAPALLSPARRFATEAKRLGAGIDDAITALRAAYASEEAR
jgi:hypothetical protein